MRELRDRVAVVTGGASGIGRGMAEAFAAEGMSLVLADIESEVLAKAVSDFEAAGTRVIGVECDVSEPESVDALARRALDAFGAVHVVCANAGVAGSPSGRGTWETGLDEWQWVMGVNVWGVIHTARAFVPILLEQGEEGHVVNTASMAGVVPGMGIYGVTKHAVVALSESMHNELANRGAKVRVSVLCPGWVRTRIAESERNRPEAPREDPGENAAQAQMMRQVVSGLIESGLDPQEVGRIVVDAIREQRFYVLTHPHWKNMIRHRVENILEDRDPVGVPPAGDGSEWSGDLSSGGDDGDS